METNLGKTMLEMSNRELFCVLTGEKGVMAQMYLQNLIRDYLAQHEDDADLQTMVRAMARTSRMRSKCILSPPLHRLSFCVKHSSCRRFFQAAFHAAASRALPCPRPKRSLTIGHLWDRMPPRFCLAPATTPVHGEEMTEPIIEIRGLEKKFSSKNGEVYALKGISLSIARGEIYGIIGRSGAGKSTLVRCINLLERPTAGQVLFEGRDLCTLGGMQLRQARRSMGMIFQQFNLLMQRTALDNVCFPLELVGTPRAEARKRAQELLEVVGLADRAHSYPSQLSGGQKQRVAIARALASSPKVLLCDEATSALDPETTVSILALIRDINKNLGIPAVISEDDSFPKQPSDSDPQHCWQEPAVRAGMDVEHVISSPLEKQYENCGHSFDD